jgi:hypothetical protein
VAKHHFTLHAQKLDQEFSLMLTTINYQKSKVFAPLLLMPSVVEEKFIFGHSRKNNKYLMMRNLGSIVWQN